MRVTRVLERLLGVPPRAAKVAGGIGRGAVRTRRAGLLAVVALVAAWAGQPKAQQPAAAFYGIGDLPGGGGVGSAVRDATRVDGTIYAVGASAVNATGASLDVPALWTRDGSGTISLQALPNLANTHVNNTSAIAITTNADYIANQARITASGNNGTYWARVDRVAGTNLNLGALSPPSCGLSGFSALSISDGGGVVYGQGANPTAFGWRPVRCQVGVGGNAPTLPLGKSWGTPVPRGTSSDGSVMVGIGSNNISTPTSITLEPYPVAFRYVHNAGTLTGTTTVIPKLRNAESIEGTWNMPVALAADGDRTVVIGDSPDYLNGAVYLTNAANEITAVLGSPNTLYRPRPLGGMTADGSVVAVTFSAPQTGVGNTPEVAIPTGNRHAYIHNSHGWFHFSSVLAAQGIDLSAMGWAPADLAITGVRTVEGVDLVFGQGRRRTAGPTGYVTGALEGFVAELPAGALAAFNPQPTPPSDLSLVGTWIAGDTLTSGIVIVFLADGTYVRISDQGFERGLYAWAGNAAGGELTFTTLYDTDGNGSASRRNGERGVSGLVAGDVMTFSDANCPSCSYIPNTRVTGEAGSIVGGWITGNPAEPDNTFLSVTLGDSGGNRLFFVSDQPGTGSDFVDRGTYTWDPVTHALVVTPTGGEPDDPDTVVLSRDERRLDVVDDDGVSVFQFARILDPRTPLVTSALTATATTGLQFAYQLAATSSPSSFNAVGLPAGLSINPTTGLISGAPTATGTFDVLLEASNTLSTSTGRNHLSLTVIAPVAVTELGPAVVTPIPAEGGEPPPVTLEFTNITGAGEISVATIDPETVLAAPEPPAGFSLGDNPIYYEITSTATFEGPVEVCFSYAGISFTGFPRLLHYDEDLETWVDITTSVNEATTTVCGLTSSFSPFAVAESSLAGAGFHAPIDPVAGSLNTVRGGATVPLKFDVYGSGGEITSPAGIPRPGFTMSLINCDSGEPEEWVDALTTGGTELRYDATAGHFVQNWKTPRQAGCYLVKVTGDGLLLSARFRVR